MRSAAAEQYGVVRLGGTGLLYSGRCIIWSAHYQAGVPAVAMNVFDNTSGGSPIVFQFVADGAEGMAQRFYCWPNGHIMKTGIWITASVVLTMTPLPGGVFA